MPSAWTRTNSTNYVHAASQKATGSDVERTRGIAAVGLQASAPAQA
jgi:hypothetical protein